MNNLTTNDTGSFIAGMFDAGPIFESQYYRPSQIQQSCHDAAQVFVLDSATYGRLLLTQFMEQLVRAALNAHIHRSNEGCNVPRWGPDMPGFVPLVDGLEPNHPNLLIRVDQEAGSERTPRFQIARLDLPYYPKDTWMLGCYEMQMTPGMKQQLFLEPGLHHLIRCN